VRRLLRDQIACGFAMPARDALAITSATDFFANDGFLDIETLPNRLFKTRSAGAKGEPFK